MTSVSGKALCRIVERQGWTLKRVTGSHHIYAKEGVSPSRVSQKSKVKSQKFKRKCENILTMVVVLVG